MKISVLPTPYAHFRRFKGSRIHSKNGSKITKNLEKNMPGNAMFLVFVFFAFFSRFCLNFWLILELQRPLGSLQNQVFFEHGSKMVSKRPSGSIWGRFWLRFGTVLGCSGSNFGFGFRIQCVFPARNPAWLSHTFFVFPLQRGGTCAAHGIKASGIIFHGECDFRFFSLKLLKKLKH